MCVGGQWRLIIRYNEISLGIIMYTINVLATKEEDVTL